ncbi:hypothetical protein LRS74_12190 [Streptomyces sp. LX-29]|uniref:hypothetical protein n=1 Tax=Streptomyces sp. LX-29 TaxID=2900152 RepID=UPI00240D92F1|nr:hypothetical protein [Streptomyces sp. LX-29]WFB07728.1 hypothetical protein LRS74_12190 [Streptomyces sp. LX-29]
MDRLVTVARLLGLILLWAFAALTFCLTPWIAMSGDSCHDGDPRFVCTAVGRQAAVYLPVYTSVGAALVGTWGAGSRRPRAALGWVLSMAALAAVWAVQPVFVS